MESMLRSDEMRCLFCDAKLPLHKKIANGQFCSAAHRKEYWKEQERLAVERLSQTDQTLRATFAELHASLAESEAAPGSHLALVNPPVPLPSEFPGSHARKKAPKKKLSFEHEEHARRSSNRDQVVRADFIRLHPSDGPAWTAFVPVSFHFDFLIPDFAPSSLQALASRFQPVAMVGLHPCGVTMAGPVKLSHAVPAPEENTYTKATVAGTTKALEPAAAPVTHDLIFRFAPEEPSILRETPCEPAETSAELPSPEVPSAPALVANALTAEIVLEETPVAEAPAAETSPFAAPAFAASIAMNLVPTAAAPRDLPTIEAAAVESAPSALSATHLAFEPSARKALALSPAHLAPLPKTLAACASASSGLAPAIAPWIAPSMLPFRELAAYGHAESLCTPPLAHLLRLPKPAASALASQPSEARVIALNQTGSLMLGARAARPIAPKLRPANAARYPLSASLSEPLQETVAPAEPHSFDVALPELQLHAVPSIEAPDWGWLMPLSFEGEAIAGHTGPYVPAAALVSAFPESREPNLPGSHLQTVPDSDFKAPSHSLRMFAHWAMPGDGSGRNPWTYATDFLSHAPRDLKLALFVIPVLLAMALHPRMPKLHVAAPTAAASTERNSNFRQVFARQWDTVQQNVASRAAVALTDDFRSGLEDWQMRGDLNAAWSFDSNGFVRPGSLALYRPSMGLTDYQLRFLGLIDRKALSFVTRAQDFKNYYVIKLVILKPGPMPTIGVTRYAVIDGKAEKRADVVAPINAMPDMLYRVDLDIHDDTYLLSLQGQIVDTWTEPRLTHGGVGFFTARGEQSRVRWVQLTHQYDMLGRLCAYLAPFNIPNTNGRW